MFGTSLNNDIYSLLQSSEQSEKIQFVNIGGEKYGIYFTTLTNHMKIITYANASEMNSQMYLILVPGIVVFIVLFTIALVMSVRLSGKMVKPLFDIIEATKQFADGNWDVKISCNSNDEIGELADNVTIMADKTKDYISQLKRLAKKDGLTGLRNRNDYLMYIERNLTDNASANGKTAVIVFDVNNLKKVNDNLGHEKEDELLQNASKFICGIFSHSPVFRIGGDEFVAIVNGADYDEADSKLLELQNHMKATNKEDILEVCIASGMAKFGIDGNTYDEVFKAADERMYHNKVELKNGEEVR